MNSNSSGPPLSLPAGSALSARRAESAGIRRPRTRAPARTTIRLIELARRVARRAGVGWEYAQFVTAPQVQARGPEANALIHGRLLSPEPCMVARIGHTEMKAVLPWFNQLTFGPLKNAWRYVVGRSDRYWWDASIRAEMQHLSGFFPGDDWALRRFADLTLTDLKSVDILGSWLPGERRLTGYFPRASTVPLSDLEPFYHPEPWTSALAGRTVLVVHPFETSIRQQYEKRKLLFADPDILPDFRLETLKAVQSLGGAAHGFATWFDALDFMCEQIARMEFDVALIGAGAYGLPLAAFVKRMGRKAVHLGGATQLLFGIRGGRWDERPFYQRLFNEHWTRPMPEETPPGHAAVDSGKSYW